MSEKLFRRQEIDTLALGIQERRADAHRDELKPFLVRGEDDHPRVASRETLRHIPAFVGGGGGDGDLDGDRFVLAI